MCSSVVSCFHMSSSVFSWFFKSAFWDNNLMCFSAYPCVHLFSSAFSCIILAIVSPRSFLLPFSSVFSCAHLCSAVFCLLISCLHCRSSFSTVFCIHLFFLYYFVFSCPLPIIPFPLYSYVRLKSPVFFLWSSVFFWCFKSVLFYYLMHFSVVSCAHLCSPVFSCIALFYLVSSCSFFLHCFLLYSSVLTCFLLY